MFTIRILKQATKELEKLDKPVARRIADRIK
jgi:mRNA-degrading endonuclease RelE of RelBE toxin-antitoxin system